MKIATMGRNVQVDADWCRSAIRDFPDAVLVLDSLGTITWANVAGETLLGNPATSLAGRALRELFQPPPTGATASPRPPVPQWVQNVETGQAVQGLRAQVYRSDGSRVPVSVMAKTIRGGILVALRNLSQDYDGEELKNQQLSMVAHELMSPLTTVKGLACTLLRTDVAWDEETRRDFLATISVEADRLTGLVTNLLTMNLLQTGMMSLQRQETDLIALAQGVIDRFLDRNPRHPLSVVARPDLPLAWADARLVGQVLTNLVQNSIKYSPDGGAVSITLSKEARGFRLVVADRGIGTPPEEAEKVFRRFYRLSHPTVQAQGGTGLGLSICRHIVSAHGGQIWIEARSGGGTAVNFTLPGRAPTPRPDGTGDAVEGLG